MTDNIKLPKLPEPHTMATYATSKNTPSVKAEYEQGGYEKTPPLFDEHQMEAYAREAVRLNAQAVSDGWKLVPVQATPDMCKAAVIYANGNAVYKNVAHEALEIEESIYSEVYAAMLSAAPAAPQPAQPPIKAELLCVCGREWQWENRSWELVSGPYPKPAQQPLLAEKDALLLQALEALEPFELSTSLAERTAEAIRNHLGVKND